MQVTKTVAANMGAAVSGAIDGSDVVSGDLHGVALKERNPPLTPVIRGEAGLERMLPDEVVDTD